MKHDVFGGKKKKRRDQAKTWWGKLIHGDLERVGGPYDKLVGLLRAKYGYNQKQAENEMNKRTK